MKNENKKSIVIYELISSNYTPKIVMKKLNKNEQMIFEILELSAISSNSGTQFYLNDVLKVFGDLEFLIFPPAKLYGYLSALQRKGLIKMYKNTNRDYDGKLLYKTIVR